MPPKRRQVPRQREEPRSPATLPAATAGGSDAPNNMFPADLLPPQAGHGGDVAAASTTTAGGGGGGVLGGGGGISDNSTPVPPTAAVHPEPNLPRFVKLNVGGVKYCTSTSTLSDGQARNSQLAEWVKNDFEGLAKDPKDGTIFINRDGKTFRHVLNYLRGYDVRVPQEDVSLLVEDALFYKVDSLMVDLGLCSPPMWRFQDGPGVNNTAAVTGGSNGGPLLNAEDEDDENYSCSSFNTTTMVGSCGHAYFTSGVHSVTWRVDKCEIVAVGGISKDAEGINGSHFKSTPGSFCYLNTGEIFANYQETVSLTQPVKGPPRFREGEQITMRVNYNPRFVSPGGDPDKKSVTSTTSSSSAALESPLSPPHQWPRDAPPAVGVSPPTATTAVVGEGAPPRATRGLMLAQRSRNQDPSRPTAANNSNTNNASGASPRLTASKNDESNAASSMTTVRHATSFEKAGLPAPPLMQICLFKFQELVYSITVVAVPLRFGVFIEGASVVTLLEFKDWTKEEFELMTKDANKGSSDAGQDSASPGESQAQHASSTLRNTGSTN